MIVDNLFEVSQNNLNDVSCHLNTKVSIFLAFELLIGLSFVLDLTKYCFHTQRLHSNLMQISKFGLIFVFD